MARPKKKEEVYSLGWVLRTHVEGDQAQIVRVALSPDGQSEGDALEVVLSKPIPAGRRTRGVRAITGKAGAVLFAGAVARATAAGA